MIDTILDDVKELLKLDKGDPKTLERIRRAAEQDEVISVYERDYVTSLVKKFLRPQYGEPVGEPKAKLEPAPTGPKIMIPETKFEKILESKSIFKSIKNYKNKKIMLGIGAAAALAVILIAGASMYGLLDLSIPSPAATKPASPPSGLAVDVDAPSYSLGDIISISGSSDAGGDDDVTLSITNGANQVIWQEAAPLKADGTYSTLLIAGGPGWESAGEYALKAVQGSVIEEISFDFKG